MTTLSIPDCGGDIDLAQAPLWKLAELVRHDWRKKDGSPNVWFGAVPYLDAMGQLVSLTDAYGADDGRTIAIYFLANAAQWRGPVARAVKAELKRRLTARAKQITRTRWQERRLR